MAKQPLYVIKIGGNIIDDEQRLSAFLAAYAALKGRKILIHGGGKLATKLAETLQIPQQMVDGRRITDVETLKVVTMVYAGFINKNIVAKLQQQGTNAIGLCGADANLVLAKQRVHPTINFGYVGDVEKVNDVFLQSLLQQDISVVIAPITHNGEGLLLNTNADTIAQEIATAMAPNYEVNLIYSFEKTGVLTDVNDESSVIPKLTRSLYQQYREEKKIFAGMIPKLDNAFQAIDSGVNTVTIGKAEALQALIGGETGTILTHA